MILTLESGYDLLCKSNAISPNVHLWFRPARLRKKRDWWVKTPEIGHNADCKAGNRSLYPLHSREISGECKFGDHILPIPSSQCTEAYKQPIPLFTRKRPREELRLLFWKKQYSLTWQKIWLMFFMAPQIYFCVCCFLHMYTLNSCHFFLYLLWIFKKCYQSTCFTVFLLSFPFSFFSFTVGLREAWVRSLKLIR